MLLPGGIDEMNLTDGDSKDRALGKAPETRRMA